FGAILTMALLLDHVGRREQASSVEAAVAACVRERRCTPDIGGSLTTSQAGDAVVEALLK
ncbi:MAG TPA: isocitrate/isopropylmalate family dehydrogenase, partial [Thermoanaerobaculia bacterium]|nr:isocitrate/isopropylmalate family dehydrogenase [Thermoanaerobaculia bacterium]